jgi:RNA polymerase sigma-70 factor (ECF subfamily)
MAAHDTLQLTGKTDEELLKLSLSFPLAFEELLERWQKPFFRKALAILRNQDDADDAVQDAFIRIYRFADRFAENGAGSFRPWGYAILMNVIFTKLASDKRERERRVALDPEAYERLPDTADAFGEMTLREYVASMLGRLSAGAARLLTLYYLEGRTQGEIAVLEGASPMAIKVRMFRARHEFKTVSEHSPP